MKLLALLTPSCYDTYVILHQITMRIIEIKGTNMDLTPAIKQRVENKLQMVAKLCTKFDPCDVRVDVGMTGKHHKKGDIYYAEFNLIVPGTSFRAEVKKDDLYAAIEQATSDLRRQVRDYKEKLRDAGRSPASSRSDESIGAHHDAYEVAA